MSYKSYRDERQKEITTKLQDNLKRAGFLVEGDAKYLCIVDTGRLRGSISTNWTGSGMSRGKVESPAKTEDGVSQPSGGKDVFEVVVGTNVEYSRTIEFGTVKMDNRPFLYPALEGNKAKIMELLKE